MEHSGKVEVGFFPLQLWVALQLFPKFIEQLLFNFLEALSLVLPPVLDAVQQYFLSELAGFYFDEPVDHDIRIAVLSYLYWQILLECLMIVLLLVCCLVK